MFYWNKTDVFWNENRELLLENLVFLNESSDLNDEMQQISSNWYINLGVSGERQIEE